MNHAAYILGTIIGWIGAAIILLGFAVEVIYRLTDTFDNRRVVREAAKKAEELRIALRKIIEHAECRERLRQELKSICMNNFPCEERDMDSFEYTDIIAWGVKRLIAERNARDQIDAGKIMGSGLVNPSPQHLDSLGLPRDERTRSNK